MLLAIAQTEVAPRLHAPARARAMVIELALHLVAELAAQRVAATVLPEAKVSAAILTQDGEPSEERALLPQPVAALDLDVGVIALDAIGRGIDTTSAAALAVERAHDQLAMPEWIDTSDLEGQKCMR